MTTWFGSGTGAGTNGFASGQIDGQQFAATATGNITAARSMILAQSGSAAPTKVLIYAVSGAAPGALLGQSDELTIPGSSPVSLRSFTFSTPVAVVSSTSYFLMLFCGGGAIAVQITAAGTNYYKNVTYPTAPNPFGTPGGTYPNARAYLEVGVEDAGGGGGGGAILERKAGSGSVDTDDWAALVDAVVALGGAVTTRKAGSGAVPVGHYNAVVDAVVTLGGSVANRKAGSGDVNSADYNALVDAVKLLGAA